MYKYIYTYSIRSFFSMGEKGKFFFLNTEYLNTPLHFPEKFPGECSSLKILLSIFAAGKQTKADI